MQRLSTIALFAAVVLVGASRTADACSCKESGPACQAFWNADAIFDATVDAVDSVTREDERDVGRPVKGREYRVSLSVRQAWKDAQTGALDAFTNLDEAACGYPFKVGRRYLVFASKRPSDGRWTVSLCSATQPYDGTGETAAFLASLAAPPRGGRVFGSIQRSESRFSEHSPREQPVETRVHLSGGAQTRSVVSTNGRFEFTGLPPGDYRVEPQLPDGYTTYNEARNVHIPTAHACARENFHLSPATRITGRVVAQDGRPVRPMRIEATDASALARPQFDLPIVSGYTDPEGYFEIRGLPAGTYILGVNLADLPNQHNPYARTLYPSEGPGGYQLPLTLGQTLEVGTWRLPPPLAIVKVAGIVMWQDGTPAAGIFIGMWDRTGDPIERARAAGGATSGADGRFSIELRQGRVYTFTARDRQGRSFPISAPRIETNAAVDPIRIVIRQDPPR